MSLEHKLVGRQARIVLRGEDRAMVGEIIAVDTSNGVEYTHIWVSIEDAGVVRVPLGKQTVILPRSKKCPEVLVPTVQDLNTVSDTLTLTPGGGEICTTLPAGETLTVDCRTGESFVWHVPDNTIAPDQEAPLKSAVLSPSKWDYAPEGYDWFARDNDDQVCFYKGRKPQQIADAWWTHSGSDECLRYYTGPKDLIKWDIPWRESLEARPGSAAERILRGEALHREAAAQPSKWDYAPEGYDWFARDADGFVYFYPGGQPECGSDVWLRHPGCDGYLHFYGGPDDLIDWDVPWDESLEARPGSAAAMQWAGEMLMEATASLNKDPRKRGLQAQMLAYLQEHKYLIFTAEKLWAMDQFRAWEIPTISKALAKLCSAGHLERVRRGWYRAI